MAELEKPQLMLPLPGPSPEQNNSLERVSSPPTKDLLRPLQRRAVIAWAGGALSVGLLWGENQARVLHPHGVLFLLLLGLTFGAALGALARGLWRLVRGPRRAAAVAWTLVALVPAVVYGLLGAYAATRWRNRQVPHNLPFTLAKMAGASLMEGQAACFYPHRLETQRLVMFYGDGVLDPQNDAEAMDRHLAHLEALTGKPLRAKVHWVRGSLLGMRYLSFYGLALGSSGKAAAVDRHELAHAVLYQQCEPDSDPPTLLLEGWAESQSVEGRTLAKNAHDLRRFVAALRRSAEAKREEESRNTIDPPGYLRLFRQENFASYARELTDPFWYHRDAGAVYMVGGAFVDFLLRRYGAARFLDLYFACRPGTFAAECQRVYGMDVDSLERQFWEDVTATLRPPAAKARGQ